MMLLLIVLCVCIASVALRISFKVLRHIDRQEMLYIAAKEYLRDKESFSLERHSSLTIKEVRDMAKRIQCGETEPLKRLFNDNNFELYDD